MRVERERWVIMRNNRTEIFCGLARNYQFKPVNDIANTAIKTCRSENTALSSFKSSWYNPNFEVEAVKVKEAYESMN